MKEPLVLMVALFPESMKDEVVMPVDSVHSVQKVTVDELKHPDVLKRTVQHGFFAIRDSVDAA